jgi:hypothetical protein
MYATYYVYGMAGFVYKAGHCCADPERWSPDALRLAFPYLQNRAIRCFFLTSRAQAELFKALNSHPVMKQEAAEILVTSPRLRARPPS